MSFDRDKLYGLLPAVFRIRDAGGGGPLKDLAGVVAEQVAWLEENLAQLYDDQFIETCADWVIPYIGDLIGCRPLHGVVPKVSSPRAEVANTIARRRRKGTAAMLEQLARDVTGWNARVVEFFQWLACTQHLNHLRPRNHGFPDLRQGEPLERLSTPFDTLAHRADVRSIALRRGRHNIPHVGIFLWRLGAYPLREASPFMLGKRRYLFNPLGNDTRLFSRPRTEDEITHLAEPANVPMPITRRVLDRYLDQYYGEDQSFFLRVNGREVGPERIRVCDLSDWEGEGHFPKERFAVDPVLGRFTLPEEEPADSEVRVTFHYGFSAEMGGGEYDRSSSLQETLPPVRVAAPKTVQSGLHALCSSGDLIDRDGAVEITDNSRYAESPRVRVQAGKRVEIRAADGRRPALILGKGLGKTAVLEVWLADDTEVTFNGLLISGGSLVVKSLEKRPSRPHRLRLRHCTLVPGLSLRTDGTPEHPGVPALIVESSWTRVEIDRCVVGPLRSEEGARIEIHDSIVDANGEAGVACAGLDGKAGGGTLHVINSTVIGRVRTVFLEMASNTLFLARAAAGQWFSPVLSDRRQGGCVRFSFLPWESQVPRRYRCRPDSKGDAARIRPTFTSLRYGDAGYCQLGRSCPREIYQGADDEAEMGAFHDLHQPQRYNNLLLRLDEYLRFGLEAGIFYAS